MIGVGIFIRRRPRRYSRNLCYLSHPQVVACGGSWMVKPDWIDSRRFDLVVEETRKAAASLDGDLGEPLHPVASFFPAGGKSQREAVSPVKFFAVKLVGDDHIVFYGFVHRKPCSV